MKRRAVLTFVVLAWPSAAWALTDSDPVSKAVTDSCTTASVKGLSTQLVEEIQCLRPGTMKSIEGVDGLDLGSAVFPWLQTPAADAVIAAQKERGVAMAINSALRTLPQQFLLYSWYLAKRCSISLAAKPGNSNHESGLAVDIQDEAGWQTVMAKHDMKWLGASDPVHFDYVGQGAADLGGLSVLAFQKLWNVNHPEDRIAEDSTYGDATEKRIEQAPIGGFAKGAECIDAGAGPVPPPPTSDAGGGDGSVTAEATPPDDDGCAMHGGRRGGQGATFSSVIALVLAALARRRPQRRRRLRICRQAAKTPRIRVALSLAGAGSTR